MCSGCVECVSVMRCEYVTKACAAVWAYKGLVNVLGGFSMRYLLDAKHLVVKIFGGGVWVLSFGWLISLQLSSCPKPGG